MKKHYCVKACSEPALIDAVWDKPFWQEIDSVEIGLSHWPTQFEYEPATEAKLQYDAENLYVIFRVQDRYVQAVTAQPNGEVWKDSCVEFFFAPYGKAGTSYFNLEVNCCGVPLMQHHSGPRTGTGFVDLERCGSIEIAASLQGPIETELTEPIVWTLEYRLPFEILKQYPEVEKPAAGVRWRGNFYKCADNSSHPHWMTWSPIQEERPDFHRPEYFGTLNFK